MPIDVPFGGHRKEKFDQSMTEAQKKSFCQNFDETYTVTLPVIGEQTFEVRANIRKLLDTLPYPTLNATFEVEGDCESEEGIVIECTRTKMTGTDHGNFQVLNLGIAYEFEAEVEPGHYSRMECNCEGAETGWRRQRTFTVAWYLRLDMNPGVGGTYEIEEKTVTVRAPCCGCPERTEEPPKETVPKRRPKPAKETAPGPKKTKGRGR